MEQEKDFKITLQAARVNAGLTLKDAANALGIATSTLVLWEKHPERISSIKQSRISDTYKIPIDRIIFLPLE